MEHLSQVGGLFAILVLLHFVADWVGQSEEEAVKKSSCWRTRLSHCAHYLVPFLLFFMWMEINTALGFKCLVILFASHYVIDSYYLTYVWARRWRKIPSICWAETKEEAREAFKAEFENPVNAILFIVIDQLQHIVFLFPVAWLLLA